MSRFARDRRVFYFEEPTFEDESPSLRESLCPHSGVTICTPVLPTALQPEQVVEVHKQLVASCLQRHGISEFCAWYYTPMALAYTSELRPGLTVYDCMDELSAFAGAPPAMREQERLLFETADLVFAGGASLYQSKRAQHSSVHLFPSSVDVDHFKRAREKQTEPEDQSAIPHPRLGYAGVIDERMDLNLVREVAASRPDWQFVFLGPVVKIDPASLPRAKNIHYLGLKSYSQLPAYFSGWDIGILPFALNDSTRFISPTKTPEYLAAGLSVLSAPIGDVVKPYGDLALARIADGASEFIREAESLLNSPKDEDFMTRVDQFLSKGSWDKTWSEMNQLMEEALNLKNSGVAQQAASVNSAEGRSHV